MAKKKGEGEGGGEPHVTHGSSFSHLSELFSVRRVDPPLRPIRENQLRFLRLQISRFCVGVIILALCLIRRLSNATYSRATETSGGYHQCGICSGRRRIKINLPEKEVEGKGEGGGSSAITPAKYMAPRCDSQLTDPLNTTRTIATNLDGALDRLLQAQRHNFVLRLVQENHL